MDFVEELKTHPSIIIIFVGFMATLASAIYVCINKNDGPHKLHGDYHEIDEDGQRLSVISDYSTNGEYVYFRGSPTSSRTNVILSLYYFLIRRKVTQTHTQKLRNEVFREKVQDLIRPNPDSDEEELDDS